MLKLIKGHAGVTEAFLVGAIPSKYNMLELDLIVIKPI